jgi:hypothetical protein
VDGATTCARLGCDAIAVAVFGFDARECLVWLDPLGSDGRGAGVLCSRHADRMSPPYGWNLIDRRGAESRLWIGRTPTVAATPPTRRRERAPRTRPCAPTGQHLPFDTAPFDTAPFESAPNDRPVTREPAAPVARADEPERQAWSPHARPGPEFEHVLDARTPLLARAFEGSRPADASD